MALQAYQLADQTPLQTAEQNSAYLNQEGPEVAAVIPNVVCGLFPQIRNTIALIIIITDGRC